MSTGARERIAAVVRPIPRGRVATYGQVARLAGLAGYARGVGHALHRDGEVLGLPWHRVVNRHGEISARSAGREAEALQRALLQREGVDFDPNGRIDLARRQWRPRARPAARGPSA